MENPPLQKCNTIYTLKPKIITVVQEYFHKLKLKIYKKQKIKESKTSHKRSYIVKFKIHIDDIHNPQASDMEYEMLVPAQAAFFAKRMAETDIQRKLRIEFTDCEEMEDEVLESFLETKENYILKK